MCCLGVFTTELHVMLSSVIILVYGVGLGGGHVCQHEVGNDAHEVENINHTTESIDDFLEDEDDSEEDSEDAFSDIEDEDMICSGYNAVPRHKKLPEAVVIGVRKGGTRALLEFINMNSRIRRAKSETHFYDNNYEKGRSWYLDQMPAVLPSQICMEKTPGYFHTAGVPKKLYEMNNQTKLVLIVRNPVDRLISDYNQFRSRHLERGNDYPPLEHFLFTPAGNINIGYQPLQRSIYHYHLVRWMRYFPHNQIHIVDGDKFIKQPWEGLKKLEDFLEIPNEITENNFFFNATKGFYCGQEIIKLPQSEWTCTRKKCLNKSKGRPKAKVEESTYKQLTKFYAPHNEIFYGLVKRYDFNWPKDWP